MGAEGRFRARQATAGVAAGNPEGTFLPRSPTAVLFRLAPHSATIRFLQPGNSAAKASVPGVRQGGVAVVTAVLEQKGAVLVLFQMEGVAMRLRWAEVDLSYTCGADGARPAWTSAVCAFAP